jgi:hypothetical protein
MPLFFSELNLYLKNFYRLINLKLTIAIQIVKGAITAVLGVVCGTIINYLIT